MVDVNKGNSCLKYVLPKSSFAVCLGFLSSFELCNHLGNDPKNIKWSKQEHVNYGSLLHLCLFSDGHKHKKSLRLKLDSLSKEKSKDKGNVGCTGYTQN